MVSYLNEEEREAAARSSYRYFTLSTSEANRKPTIEEKNKAACAMARRHLIAEKGYKQKAFRKMKATIRHRKEMKIDALRRCFETDTSNSFYSELRTSLEEELSTGKMIIRGYDKENRALFNYFPRLKNSEHEVNFLRIHYYMLERALACTERASDGSQEKIVVLVDYNGYKGAIHDPPLKLTKKMIVALNEHYPERLFCVYLINAPLLFRTFWALIKPFLDPVTKKKFRFVTGDKERGTVFADKISADQAMPFVLPCGKMNSPIDPKKFFYDTPFDYAYDES
mmetsp:Transcript_17950/g.24709  ORF Transcript_17950/g.24709 Transcript_17950/m.24709 type:complete len:283 (-) Transcript_17950:214-1062(-)